MTTSLKNKWFVFFFLLACAASLPVMLVSRQQGHYILQAYPLFAVAFAQILDPVTHYGINTIVKKNYRFMIGMAVSIILLIIAMSMLIINAGKLGAYKALLQDTLLVGEVIPPGSIVYLSPSLYNDMKNHSFMYRYNQIGFSATPCCKYQLWAKKIPPKKLLIIN